MRQLSRSSIVVVWLFQVAYHALLMAGAGYADVSGLGTSLALFAVGDPAITFIMAKESYRARSLWPAVFFHSFHNPISQWPFLRLFSWQEPWLNGGPEFFRWRVTSCSGRGCTSGCAGAGNRGRLSPVKRWQAAPLRTTRTDQLQHHTSEGLRPAPDRPWVR